MTELRIHMRHVRQVRGHGVTCTNGIRAWCALHGVDLRVMASEGMTETEAQRIGGAFADAAIAIARKEATGGI
ncbi:MAG: hypothetical protein ACOH2M_23310 [Cypionkella sp.]